MRLVLRHQYQGNVQRGNLCRCRGRICWMVGALDTEVFDNSVYENLARLDCAGMTLRSEK